jgi:hypothetical protein
MVAADDHSRHQDANIRISLVPGKDDHRRPFTTETVFGRSDSCDCTRSRGAKQGAIRGRCRATHGDAPCPVSAKGARSQRILPEPAFSATLTENRLVRGLQGIDKPQSRKGPTEPRIPCTGPERLTEYCRRRSRHLHGHAVLRPDTPGRFTQLDAPKGDIRRRPATARRCLLSSGSRVRILPGALGGLHVSAGPTFTFGLGLAARL